MGVWLLCRVMVLLAAQQEAQRAMFIVEKAKQERQEKVVRAEGEAEAARMISLHCHTHLWGEGRACVHV